MPARIFAAREFDRWAKKLKITDGALITAANKVDNGLAYASLNDAVAKQPIAREGEGARDGFHTIVIFRKGQRVVFIAGLAKNDRPTFTSAEEAVYKALAETILGYTEGEMDAKVVLGAFREIARPML